jgi:PAS domain S-box-containing protein
MPEAHPDLRIGANLFSIQAEGNQGWPDMFHVLAKEAESLLSGGDTREQLLQRCQIGDSESWIRTVMTRFEENGAIRVVVSCQDVTELMSAKDELARNQERLHMALEASHTGTWEWDIAKRNVRWTDNQGLIFDEDKREFVGDYRDLLLLVHPEDRHIVESTANEAFHGGDSLSVQFRILDRQGAVHWILAKGKISRDGEGNAVRMIGVNVDITEIKRRDQELQKLASRLIEAQEEERRRISRELHDDIGQRISLLACELDLRRQALSKLRQNQESAQIVKLQMQAEELATDVHELSHELHSSKLQHCGLETALRDLCEKYHRNHSVAIELVAENVAADLPSELSLCLFRVTQEALANAVRHSQTKTISVFVGQTSGRIRLTVNDAGVGFDPSAQSEGIGLTSMRERLRIVGGTLHVKTSPGAGTAITAEVSVPAAPPLRAEAAGSGRC